MYQEMSGDTVMTSDLQQRPINWPTHSSQDSAPGSQIHHFLRSKTSEISPVPSSLDTSSIFLSRSSERQSISPRIETSNPRTDTAASTPTNWRLETLSDPKQGLWFDKQSLWSSCDSLPLSSKFAGTTNTQRLGPESTGLNVQTSLPLERSATVLSSYLPRSRDYLTPYGPLGLEGDTDDSDAQRSARSIIMSLDIDNNSDMRNGRRTRDVSSRPINDEPIDLNINRLQNLRGIEGANTLKQTGQSAIVMCAIDCYDHNEDSPAVTVMARVCSGLDRSFIDPEILDALRFRQRVDSQEEATDGNTHELQGTELLPLRINLGGTILSFNFRAMIPQERTGDTELSKEVHLWFGEDFLQKNSVDLLYSCGALLIDPIGSGRQLVPFVVIESSYSAQQKVTPLENAVKRTISSLTLLNLSSPAAELAQQRIYGYPENVNGEINNEINGYIRNDIKKNVTNDTDGNISAERPISTAFEVSKAQQVDGRAMKAEKALNKDTMRVGSDDANVHRRSFEENAQSRVQSDKRVTAAKSMSDRGNCSSSRSDGGGSGSSTKKIERIRRNELGSFRDASSPGERHKYVFRSSGARSGSGHSSRGRSEFGNAWKTTMTPKAATLNVADESLQQQKNTPKSGPANFKGGAFSWQ